MSKNRSSTNFVLVLTLTVFIIVGLLYANHVFSNKSTYDSVKTDGYKSVGEVGGISNNSSVYTVEDLLLEVEDSIVRGKNIAGTVSWTIKLGGKVEKAVSSSDRTFLVDDKKITCISKTGKVLWSGNLQDEVTDIYTDKDGSVLLEYREGFSSRCEVYNPKGIRVGNLLIENAYILSYTSGINSTFVLSILDIASEAVKSKVLAYNYKSEIVWANNHDDKIIPMVYYMRNNVVLAVGEKELILYKADGKEEHRKEISGKLLKTAAKDNTIVAIVKERGSTYALAYDVSLKEQARVKLEKQPLGIHVLKNGFILYNKDEFSVYDGKGKVKQIYKSNSDISGLNVVSEDKIYLQSGRRLVMLEKR